MTQIIIKMSVTFAHMCLFLLYIGSCSSSPVERNFLVYASEGMQANPQCESGSMIKTTAASYKSVENPKCQSSILTQVAAICEKKQSCTVIISAKNFGDPCPMQFKKAEIVYECIKNTIPIDDVETNQMYADEGMKLTISCKEGQKIKVHFGLYGKFSEEIGCDPIERRETHCFKTITHYVSGRCTDKLNCDVIVHSKDLGDPCPGIQKRAVVYFRCVRG